MTKILITANFPDSLIQKFSVISSSLEIDQRVIGKDGWPEQYTTDAQVIYSAWHVPDIRQAPNLRWIQSHWAGVDHLHDDPIWESDIKLTTSSGLHAPNMGQYALAQILSWANRVNRWFDYQRQSEWPSDRWGKLLPVELRGSTLGILGYGSIGREVARLAKSFGMRVLATKRDARSIVDNGYIVPGTGDRDGMMPDRIYPPEAIRSVVGECDFIVITLPLTPMTHHLIDEQLLRSLKKNCYLINVGRGQLIDEVALVRALNEGWIAGAGLDVFEQEPLPQDSPLWEIENLIISPHVSGFTPHYDDRATDIFAENIRRYLKNEPLLNLVDRDVGY